MIHNNIHETQSSNTAVPHGLDRAPDKTEECNEGKLESPSGLLEFQSGVVSRCTAIKHITWP